MFQGFKDAIVGLTPHGVVAVNPMAHTNTIGAPSVNLLNFNCRPFLLTASGAHMAANRRCLVATDDKIVALGLAGNCFVDRS